MIASEVAPYVKVGGLGDVVGALPKAIEKLGHDVRVICPLYGSIVKDENWNSFKSPFNIYFGGKNLKAKIWESTLPNSNVKVYFIEYNVLYAYKEVYSGPWGAHENNDRRFIFLCRSGIELSKLINWQPDVIHCHDWPTAPTSLMLKTSYLNEPKGNCATVLTIHSIQHQGSFHAGILDYAGVVSESIFDTGHLETNDQLNFLKCGLIYSTKITTVSPNYAREIQTPEYGYTLDKTLISRSSDLVGILNGIDREEWNPQIDIYIPKNYSSDNLKGKYGCKAHLQKSFGLKEKPDILLFGVVARLYEQKGIDLLADIIPRMMEQMIVQLVILGNGDTELEKKVEMLANRYSDRLGFQTGFHNSLAHLVYAGSDSFIMPSRFEPCGLSQMYAMNYGTPPVARATGGLIDTIDQYVEGSEKGTGFLFDLPTQDALYYTLGWACSTYYDRPAEFLNLQLNGMKKDFSWDVSAKLYEQVYKSAIEAERVRILLDT